MNVVIVNDYARVYGGAAKVAISSAVELAHRGVRVVFFAAVGPVANELERVPNLEVVCLGNVPYTTLPAGRAMREGLWDRTSKAALGEVLSKLPTEATVVHIHSNRDALSASVAGEPFERAIPVVYSNHDYTLGCPYGAFFNQRTLQICPYRGLSAKCVTTYCNRGSRLKRLWMTRRQMVQVSTGIPSKLSDVVYVSDFSRKILESYVPANAGILQHVVRNPVDADPGQRRTLSSDSPFVFVGLFDPGKDPITAAEAARKAGVPITFVGDGEFRERILAANPSAEITGWLSSGEVRQRLLTARGLVFPVRWYETQGLVVQEAASVGLPAIVSDTSAATDTIQNGVTGFTFPAGDSDQLAKKMALLMDDGTCRKLGDELFRQFWRDPPTLAKHVDRLMEIYTAALARKRSAA